MILLFPKKEYKPTLKRQEAAWLVEATKREEIEMKNLVSLNDDDKHLENSMIQINL